MRHLFVLSLLLGATAVGQAQPEPACAPLDATQVAALFDEWNLALSTLDADRVTQRYWPDAVLLPTLSNTPRTSAATIRDYFTHFLAERPRGRLLTRTVQLGCNMAVDAGTYAFSLMDKQGRTREVTARYTYVYQFRAGAWKIAHHHSSATPEGAAADATQRSAKVVKEIKRPAGGTQLFLNAEASPAIEGFHPATLPRQGQTVAMRVCASASGEISAAPEILQTSGSSDLDSAAQAWASAARWIPATQRQKTVAGCADIRVVFPRDA